MKFLKILQFALLPFIFINQGCSFKTENQGIQIHPEDIISKNIIGNGVQWSAYPHADSPSAEWGDLMTDEKWQMNYDRLDYMKPNIFRVLDQANWRYITGFDDDDNPIIDFNTTEIKSLEKILKYAQKNNIKVLLGEWGTPYKFHDLTEGHGTKYTGTDDPKWINGIVKFLDYLINKRGYTCIQYYNLVNEPNGYWATTEGSFSSWSKGVKLLHSELEKHGLLNKVSIAGPDVVAHYDNPKSEYTGPGWVKESVKQLDDYLGIYDVHAYTNYELVRSGKFKAFYSKISEYPKKVNKEIFFGEIGFSPYGDENKKRIKEDLYASGDSQMDVYDYSYGVDMADAAIQIMNSGYTSAMAWALDDAMHTKGDLGEKNQLKRWGFWNSLGTEICNNPDDENIRPWFYTWSLMSRYFPNGSNIIKSDSTNIDGLRLTVGTKKDDMSIAIVNNSDVNQSLQINTDKLKHIKNWKKFIYSEKLMPVDENYFPVPSEKQLILDNKNSITIEIPSKSFILYTSFQF
jgi:hypothetical protein